MTQLSANQTQITRIIRAPREKVFEAFTREDHMRQWCCPEGASLEEVSIDARPGGSFRLHMRGADGATYTAVGIYREVDEPARLVYTWDWVEKDHRMGDTLVTVEFTEVGGGTELCLTHSGFPTPEAAEGHHEGWGSCLSKLPAVVE